MQHGSERTAWGEGLSSTLRRVATHLGRGTLGLSLCFILSKPFIGTAASGEGTEGAPPLCGDWHRGDGESRPINLAQTERGYREFKESLSQSLPNSFAAQARKSALVGYHAGLVACTKVGIRRVTPAKAVPESLRGRRFWFFTIPAGGSLRIPEEVRKDPEIVPLVSNVEKLEELARASNAVARPVSLAPKGLAEALGVRCGPALVAISREGEVEIHEGP